MYSSSLFSASRCFPRFSWSRFFRAQVFQGPGFLGSWIFGVEVYLSPAFSESGFRVWVLVLEIALFLHIFQKKAKPCYECKQKTKKRCHKEYLPIDILTLNLSFDEKFSHLQLLSNLLPKRDHSLSTCSKFLNKLKYLAV